MWTKVKHIVALGLVGMIVTGCSSGTDSLTNSKAKVVQLRYWVPEPFKVLDETVEKFRAEHPNLQVVRIEKTSSGASPRWPFQPGEVDVVVLPPNSVGQFSCQGLLREVPDNLIQPGRFAERDLWNSLLIRRRHYDLPITLSPLAVFSWPDLVVDHAAEGRKSWQDLLGMAQEAATKRSPDGTLEYGLAVHPTAAPVLKAMVVQTFMSEGHYPLPEVRYLRMDSKGLAPGIEIIHALFLGAGHAYHSSNEKSEDSLVVFAQRKAAMLVADYDTALVALKDLKGWKVELIPKLGNMHVPVASVTSVAVAADTKLPDQSFELATLLAGENSERILAAQGALPAQNPLQPLWLRMGGHLVTYPRDVQSEEVEFATEIERAAAMLVQGTEPPSQVLRHLTERQTELSARSLGQVPSCSR